jgi:hypothetical protein
MSRSTFVVLLLLALPGLGAERASRARVNSKGSFSVRLVEKDKHQCTLEMSRESGPVWSLEQCVGGVDDLYFASDDGERVWVLYPLAPKGTRKLPGKKGKKLPEWSNTTVAVEYDRQGRRVQERSLLDFVGPKELSEVRQLGEHLKWLEGQLGVPGKGPRLTDDGRIEFETLGGGSKTHQLKF